MHSFLLSFFTPSTAQAASPFLLQREQITTGADFIPSLANRILDLILFLAYPLAFAGLLYCAYLLIVSAGKPEAYTAVKKNFLNIVTGIVIIIFTGILINFVMSLFR